MSKNELIVKSNQLIEASTALSLLEWQVILFAICISRETQTGFEIEKPVVINAQDFASKFGTNKAIVHVQLKDAIDRLYSRSMRFYEPNLVGKAQWSITDTRLIYKKTAYVEGSGRFELLFTPDMIQFITRLESEFTSYLIDEIKHMTSPRAIQMYELCAQYSDIGTRLLEIHWLRGALGLEEHEYPKSYELKRRIIDVAVDQINEHTSLYVTAKTRMTARVVTHLELKIKKKPKPKDLTADPAIKKSKKIPIIDKKYIEHHALVGESYDAAEARLRQGNLKFGPGF